MLLTALLSALSCAPAGLAPAGMADAAPGKSPGATPGSAAPQPPAQPVAPAMTFAEEKCTRGLLGPEQWVYTQAEAGWNGNGDKAREEAVARAKEEALTALKQKTCAGFSAADCDAVQKYVYDRYVYDDKDRLACVVAGVRPEHVQRSPSLKEAEAALSALSAQLQQKIPAEGAPLVVGSVRDSAGCALPELEAVRLLLSGQLSVPQHELSAQQANDRRLLLEAAQSGDRIQLSAWLSTKPGERIPLGSAGLPAAAWQISSMKPVCRGDGPMGLQSGRLPGSAFGISLQHDGTDDRFCEGESFNLLAHTDSPARVNVYSVLPDGRAWHVWPMPGQDNLVSGTRTLDRMVAGPTPGGDEYLLAVAVPQGSPPNALDRHTGFCRAATNPGPGWYPPGASAAAITWRIDDRNCTANPAEQQAKMQQIENLLKTTPVCQ